MLVRQLFEYVQSNGTEHNKVFRDVWRSRSAATPRELTVDEAVKYLGRAVRMAARLEKPALVKQLADAARQHLKPLGTWTFAAVWIAAHLVRHIGAARPPKQEQRLPPT